MGSSTLLGERENTSVSTETFRKRPKTFSFLQHRIGNNVRLWQRSSSTAKILLGGSRPGFFFGWASNLIFL